MEVTFAQPSLTALLSGSASALVQLTGLAGGSLGLDGGASFSPLGVSLLAPEISVEGAGCRVGQSGEATSVNAASLVQLASVLSGALTESDKGEKREG